MPSHLFRIEWRLLIPGVALAAVLCLGGCGQKVEMKPLSSAVQQVADPDKAKVKDFLDKAGIQGDITAITPQGNTWLVEVQPPSVPAQPGKRAMPTPPTSYYIDQASGKVSPAM